MTVKASFVSAEEFIYLGKTDYSTLCESIAVDCPRGSYAALQVLLTDVPEGAEVVPAFSGEAAGLPWEMFESLSVNVPGRFKREQDLPFHPVLKPPFRVYDALAEFSGSHVLAPRDGQAVLYFSAPIGEDTLAGTLSGELTLTFGKEELRLPFSVQVRNVTVPEPTLIQVNSYRPEFFPRYAGLNDEFLTDPMDPVMYSPEFDAYETVQFKAMLRMRERTLSSGLSPVYRVISENPTVYEFDFTPVERLARHAFSMGFTGLLNRAPIARRLSWQKSTMVIATGAPCMSFEAYTFLSQYLPALEAFLKKNGWDGCFYQSISDEPNEYSAVEYRALAGLVHKLAPSLVLYDAQSYGEYFGSVDIAVPLNNEYWEHRKEYEKMRKNGTVLWNYSCCVPREKGYVNRFLDIPLLAARYQFWGNYACDLEGFLHWGWLAPQYPEHDFMEDTEPVHHNADAQSVLPSGDSHIVYPVDGKLYISMRLEATRAGAEDYELFRLLEKKDKTLADAICAECFTAMNEVDYDVAHFEAARSRLLEALCE